MPVTEYNATVAQRVELAPGLIILRIVPDNLPFDFKAGQYVVLGLKTSAPRIPEADDPVDTTDPAKAGARAADPDRMIRKAYSIASGSRSDDFLEFYITVVMSGELTPRLFNLEIKDRLYVGPKAVGMFTLDKAPRDHHVLLVATGTGLAPYMSMLRSDLECGGQRRFVILHGARYSWDLGYRTELVSLARHCPNLSYIPIITRPSGDPTWRGRSGYLQDAMFSGVIEEETGLALNPETFHVYLCGNPSMIEQTIAGLVERGFVQDRGHDVGTIHTELYW